SCSRLGICSSWASRVKVASIAVSRGAEADIWRSIAASALLSSPERLISGSTSSATSSPAPTYVVSRYILLTSGAAPKPGHRPRRWAASAGTSCHDMVATAGCSHFFDSPMSDPACRFGASDADREAGVAQSSSGPAILVEGLVKSFGEVRALRGIDL